MKLFRMFGRSVRDAFKSVFRNFSLSFASILCITITLIIVGASILATLNVKNFTEEIERDVTIVAFLNSDVDDTVRENFELSVKKNSNIETFTFKAKEEVKEDMIKENETFSKVISGWDKDSNPLMDTYTIKVYDVNNDKYAEFFKNLIRIRFMFMI